MLAIRIVLNTAYGSVSPRLLLNLTVPTCVFVRSVSSVIYDEMRMPLAA